MNLFKIGMITVFMGGAALPQFGAYAEVVRNPVDLNPTALQNSGASYGANIVTHPSKHTQNSDAMVTTTTTTETYTQNDPNEDLTYDQLNSRDPGAALPAGDYDQTKIASTHRIRSAKSFDQTNRPVINEDPTIMSAVPNQQAQEIEPAHFGAGFWTIAVLAILVFAGGFYSNRRRHSQGNFKA